MSTPNPTTTFAVVATVGNDSDVHLWKLRTDGSNDDKDRERKGTFRHLCTLSVPGMGSTVALNSVRFSPCGLHLAACGDQGTVVCWSVPRSYRGGGNGAFYWFNGGEAEGGDSGDVAEGVSLEKAREFGESFSCKVVPSPSVEDVFDLAWSPDSLSFVTGSLDHRVCVYSDSSVKGDEKEKENKGGEASTSRSASPVPPAATIPNNVLVESSSKTALSSANNLPTPPQTQNRQQQQQASNPSIEPLGAFKLSYQVSGTDAHTHYVQGVSLDPLGGYVATQSSDRTVRVFPTNTGNKKNAGGAFGKGARIKMRDFAVGTVSGEKEKEKEEEEEKPGEGEKPKEKIQKAHSMYLDENMGTFFRRLAWTPDGAFLITPTGIYQKERGGRQSFATYVYARHNWDQPVVCLTHDEASDKGSAAADEKNITPGGKPSVAVRPSPIVYKLPPNAQKTGGWKGVGDNLNHRSIFAILTRDTIYIHDTFHSEPLVVLKGLHYANLTDCCWSSDGRSLIVSSSDGYVSLVTFSEGELGIKIEGGVKQVVEGLKETAVDSATLGDVMTAPTEAVKKVEVVMPPTEGGDAVLVAPPAKKKKVADTRETVEGTLNSSDKKGLKRRITPVLLKGDNAENAENSENTVNTNENTSDNAKGDEIEKRVEKLTVDQGNAEKKKKKRITPQLLQSQN